MLESFFPKIVGRALGAALTSLILFTVFGGKFIKILAKKGMGQRVSKWGPKEHFVKEGVPSSGGIFIFIVVTISSLLWVSLSNKYFHIAYITFLSYTVIGFADDVLKKKSPKRGFTIPQKFLLQLLVGFGISLLCIFYVSLPTSLIVPFTKYYIQLSAPVFFFFILLIIVGSSNAVNLTDGLDGLATGHLVISFSILLIFTYLSGHSVFAKYLEIFYSPEAGELSVFIMAVLGASLGFLWFNIYPAEVFLGDSGSLSLGALVGILCILGKVEMFLPIFGGIFVIEALSVILQVLYFKTTGKRIFKMSPLHHHFELSGWAEPKVTQRFIIISIIFAIISLLGIKVKG